MFALVLLCGFQFFFLPFIHFHPDNTHAHITELSPHHHPGHFHSHELETLTHLISHGDLYEVGHHHSDPESDHHHSNTFDDTGFENINLFKPKLEKESSVVIYGVANSDIIYKHSDPSSFFHPEILSKRFPAPRNNFISRSPPAFLI
ncbi:MAG: hypothetical protein H8E32_01575 [Nitrospinae bacterium]|nr:hypothetical protein [Nitrospinota bacterium]